MSMQYTGADSQHRHRGLALHELLTTIICVFAIASLTMVALGAGRQDGNAPLPGNEGGKQDEAARHRAKDASTLRHLQQVLIVFAHDAKGMYPRPGLINRKPVEIEGMPPRNIPGAGAEDITRNTTANLYSLLIAQNYITPELCISPLERNPKVTVDSDYNYDAYQPVNDSYWDATFTADLETGSNVSYAHMAMTGKRVTLHWRDTMLATVPNLSSRGPKDGQGDAASLTCDDDGQWSGHVAFADAHVEWLATMTPDRLTYDAIDEATGERKPLPDNIFAMETGMTGSDLILSMTKSITEKAVVLQHD